MKNKNSQYVLNSQLEELVNFPEKYDLFKAISILEKASLNQSKNSMITGGLDGNFFRLGGKCSLRFESSDITTVTEDIREDVKYKLVTPFMSLATTSGPLPQPFCELILARNASRDFATSEFLDIFHHRILSLFYLARKKRYVSLSWESSDSSLLARAINNIAALGRGETDHKSKEQMPWLRHAGILSGIPRSLTGLISILRDRFKLEKIYGEQFVGGWQSLSMDELVFLHGKNHKIRLGKNSILGEKIWSNASSIKLILNLDDWHNFLEFIPSGKKFRVLKNLILGYLSSDLEVKVALFPKVSDLRPLVLSANKEFRLGWSSWLGKPSSTSQGQVNLKLGVL